MLRKIIAAYNEGPDALDGLVLACSFAELGGGEVLIARVMQDLKTANTVDRPAQLLMRERLGQTRNAVAQTLGSNASLEVYPVIDSSIPGALHEVVETERGDLMTFVATHLGRFGRFALGGAAESVLTGSPCPVAVAPHGFRDRPPWRPRLIGVAYDASAESEVALDLAVGIAGMADATLRLIAVAPTWLRHRIRLGGPPSGAHELEERLEDAAARAESRSTVERTLLSGDPAGTLATEATRLDALVVGSRGHGPLGRVLLSSVSTALMHAPACPLIVVPRRHEGSGGDAA